MSYHIKEIFYSLQGEGLHTGRPAVFCRFSWCNLACSFCDTNFEGTDGPNGGVYQAPEELVAAIKVLWPESGSSTSPFVVCTGGEPLLQLDSHLLDALHTGGMIVAVETNGTIPAPRGIDWLTVSPKNAEKPLQDSGNELKLLYPQRDVSPEQFEALDFEHFILQPLDTGQAEENRQNTQAALEYCLRNPKWRLSLQIHKILSIE